MIHTHTVQQNECQTEIGYTCHCKHTNKPFREYMSLHWTANKKPCSSKCMGFGDGGAHRPLQWTLLHHLIIHVLENVSYV